MTTHEERQTNLLIWSCVFLGACTGMALGVAGGIFFGLL